MRRCGQCDKTEAVVFTTLPAQVRCSVDGKLHEMSEQCKIEFVPLRHGRWIYTDNGNERYDSYKCSVCGNEITVDYEKICDIGFVISDMDYCNHCGAKMDEVSE